MSTDSFNPKANAKNRAHKQLQSTILRISKRSVQICTLDAEHFAVEWQCCAGRSCCLSANIIVIIKWDTMMLREWLVVAGVENETATDNQNIKSATIMACVIAAYI